MSEAPLGIGVLGAGYWGPNLIRNVAACPDARLAAVCDANEAALAKQRAQYPDARFHARLEALLEDPGVEAVIVATPARRHAEHALAVLRSGRHALVEKPLASSSAATRELVIEARHRKLTLMVGHTFLHNNVVAKVREILASGALGEVLYLYSQRLNLGQVRHDVAALWNLAPHDISIAGFLLDARPVRVQATGLSYIRREQGIADVSFFTLHYENGVAAHGHVSWLDPLKVRQHVVVGSRRMLVYDDMSRDAPITIYDKSVEKDFLQPFSSFAEFSTRIRAGDVERPAIALEEPLAEEIRHFVRSVRSARPPRTDGIHGMEVVLILEALSRSMATGGGEVAVDYSSIPLP